jgi:hypothetical protein
VDIWNVYHIKEEVVVYSWEMALNIGLGASFVNMKGI